MERNQPKYVLDLKNKIAVQQQNINRLYAITSALYQEIQDLKHFTNFKHSDSLADVENVANKFEAINLNGKTGNSTNVETADPMTGTRGRKMKIINN